jgi:Rifampin ADP-ribosyl transferase
LSLSTYEDLSDPEKAKKNYELATSFKDKPSDKGPFYHGTKADLSVGDLLTAGGSSNYKSELRMNHIYFTALVNGAGLAAALAKGDGRERVYIIEPTEGFENDPNVTDKKFPGNPTRSYRSQAPLKIVGEVTKKSHLSELRKLNYAIRQWMTVKRLEFLLNKYFSEFVRLCNEKRCISSTSGTRVP